jgi:hypothetical protein
LFDGEVLQVVDEDWSLAELYDAGFVRRVEILAVGEVLEFWLLRSVTVFPCARE